MMYWHEAVMVDLFWHVSALELFWIALAAFGVWLAALNGLEALRDFQALGGKTNGRRTIAVGNLRREVVRGLIHFAYLLIGIAAASIPSHPTDEFPTIAVVLILAAAGMTLNSYLDRRDRVYLLLYGLQPRDEAGRFVSDK